MRSKLWQFYDNLYYKFERWYDAFGINLAAKKQMRGIHFEKEVYERYKDTILPYWSQFGLKPGIWWTKRTYKKTRSLDPRYIPNDIYYRDIIPYFNDMRFMSPITDKNLISVIFPNTKRPVTVIKHMSGDYCLENFAPIPREDVFALFHPDKEYIIKPTLNTSSGSDIKFFSNLRQEELDMLLNSYEHIDFIIQEALSQHPDLAALNPTSINTIRLVTLCYKCEPIILSAVLRVGGSESRVDNIGAGGYQCTIDPNGRLGELAYTNRSGKDEHVPSNNLGIPFSSVVIPHYEKVRNTALSLAVSVPHLRLIAWDLSVDPEGNVVLIECNATFPGQNQGNCGPTFGDRTEEILTDIFGKK